ncbi:GAF domain-containing protein, partial [bacterium]|nr:GAF domain-containing protein [bacterium]
MEAKHRLKAQLNALHSITNMLCSGFDLDKVLEQILEKAVELFQADAGSVLLLENGVLRIRKAIKLSAEIVENTRIELGHGIVGRVAESGEAMLLNGKVDSSKFNDLVEREEDIPSAMCAPMMRNNNIVGVVNVRRSDKDKFTSDDLAFFKALASQAAVAIEIANLYQAERERSEQLRIEKMHMQAIFAHMADAVVVFDGN